MSDKILKARIKQKTDTKANWDKAVNFVPLKGEIIVYSDLNKIKVGDGAKKVSELPFLADNDTKVTSVANHYTPTADSSSELTATLPGTARAYAKDTEYTVLTGVKAQRDAKGHVTGLTYTAQKIKDTNTTYTFNGAVSTIKDSNLTASRALISDNSGKIAVSDVTSTELSYLDGVTSSIQTQLNAKSDKTTYEWNKEFAAGSNGAISLGRYNIYDSQLTFDITSTTNQSISGKLVIATQNGTIHQAKVFGDASGALVSKLIIYQSAISNSRSWVEVFCNFNGWSKNKVHIYAIALNSETVQKQMTSVTISNGVPAAANVTSGDTKWTGTIVNDFNHSHDISIATSSGTNQLTLAHGTKYSLTAGGRSFIFTTPSDNNTHNSHAIISGTKSDNSTQIKGSASSGDITLGDSGVAAGAYGDTAAQTPGYNATFKVPSISVNAKGIVTAIGEHTVKIPASDNTNTSHSHSAGIGLVGSGSAGTSGIYTYKAKLRSETALTVDSAAATTTSGRVYPVAVDKSGYLSVNVPWTDTNTHQTVADKNPTLVWGTKSTVATIGSTDIHVTMPANPNTDTHWTARSYVGSKDAHANTTTTNGNTYLQLFENGTIRDQHNIVGSGATTVASDASGKITINTDVSGKADKSYVDNRVSGYESWTFTTLSGTTITKKVCIHN